MPAYISKEPKEIPWHRNAPSFLIVDSIFAGLSAILFGGMATSENSSAINLILIFLSFFLFAFTAERITDALDEDNVRKYVAALLPYNIAVILLLISSSRYCLDALSQKFDICSDQLIIWNLLILIVLVVSPWVTDSWYLLFANRSEFSDYLKELKGEKPPRRKYGWYENSFYSLRSCWSRKK